MRQLYLMDKGEDLNYKAWRICRYNHLASIRQYSVSTKHEYSEIVTEFRVNSKEIQLWEDNIHIFRRDMPVPPKPGDEGGHPE